MKRKVVHLVAAARPNFMKIAPLYHALRKTTWCAPHVVYTGQHLTEEMAGTFIQELGLPVEAPVFYLGASGPCAVGDTMNYYGSLLKTHRPDAVVVPGDVNGSLGCALATKHADVPLVHLEAGLRSMDRRMCEEINRVAIDAISDLLWASEYAGVKNLWDSPGKVKWLGNIMIDSLEMLRPRIETQRMRERYKTYALATIHRPSNVDNHDRFEELMRALRQVADEMAVLFPMHPRTHNQFRTLGFAPHPNIHVVDPLPYIEFMALVMDAAIVITDSGGVQEETTYLGIPCATLRENTERPVTLRGTNRLVKPADLIGAVEEALSGKWPKGEVPLLWDGRTAGRCVESLQNFLGVV